MKIHALKLLLLASSLALATAAQAQSLVGAWSFGDTTGDESGVLVFFANGYYVHIEDSSPTFAPSAVDGYERGTYSWSGVNGSAFTSTTLADTGGDTGLSGLSQTTTTFSVAGNTLTITNPDGPDTGSSTLTRVTGTGIVGAWHTGDITASLSSSVVVFLSNNTYFLAADQPFEAGSPNGTAGMERGTYSWNSATNTFTATPVADTNGMFGLSHPPLITSADVVGGVLSLTDSEGTTTLNSVSAVPEPSTYAACAGLAALGLALWRRRRATTG